MTDQIKPPKKLPNSVRLIGHAKVKTIKKPAKYPSSAESIKPVPTAPTDTTEFCVEKILDKRYWNGRPQLRIKWLGYPEEESTWEPQENFGNCMDLLTDFEAELYKKRMHLNPLVEMSPQKSSPKSTPKNTSKNVAGGSKVNKNFNLPKEMDKLHIKTDTKKSLPKNIAKIPNRSSKSNNMKIKQEVVFPDKVKKTNPQPYEHRSFLNLSSESSDDDEPKNVDSVKPIEPEVSPKESTIDTFSLSSVTDLSSDTTSPGFTKRKTLGFIKEQARKWRAKKVNHQKKLNMTPTSRPGKRMQKKKNNSNMDDSTDTVLQRMHSGPNLSRFNPSRHSFHNDRQESKAPTTTASPVTPKNKATRRVSGSGRSPNKDLSKIPNKNPSWNVTPRLRRTPYGLERGLELDKVVHHFKMDKKIFLFVQWKGMGVTDALLLEDIIDIYPQHIIKYMESCKLIPPSKN